ncbi:MAG TPA: hypothetical protein VIJ11_06040 [Galbitalea sp.]
MPGRSAFGWNEFARMLLRYWATPTGGVAVVCVIARQFGATVLVPVVVASAGAFVAIIVVIFVVLAIVVPRKERGEIRSGYTSLNGRHLEVAQVAPHTNLVIREAGHPALNFESYVRSVTRARMREDRP